MVWEQHQPALWASSVALFGVGDAVTTAAGLRESTITEGNPISKRVLEEGGTAAMIGWKALVLGGFFAASRHAPPEWRVGIPLGLTLLGGGVTAFNTAQIIRARQSTT